MHHPSSTPFLKRPTINQTVRDADEMDAESQHYGRFESPNGATQFTAPSTRQYWRLVRLDFERARDMLVLQSRPPTRP
ncbi:hypothetical protein PRIC2_009586 [Phytophthora ramorum]